MPALCGIVGRTAMPASSTSVGKMSTPSVGEATRAPARTVGFARRKAAVGAMANGTRVAASSSVFLPHMPCSPSWKPWSDHSTTIVLSRAPDAPSASSTRPTCASMNEVDA